MGTATSPPNPVKRVGSHLLPVKPKKEPQGPPITGGFLRVLGTLLGLSVVLAGFFAPWTTGLLLMVAGLAFVVMCWTVGRRRPASP